MMRFNDLTAELSGAAIGDGFLDRVRASFSRGYRRAIAARQASAQAKMSGYLSHHTDERLADFGFGADEIKAIRRQAGREPRLWF